MKIAPTSNQIKISGVGAQLSEEDGYYMMTVDNSNVTRGQEQNGAKDALWWAAMTYVVAALSSLVILIWLILRYMGSRD